MQFNLEKFSMKFEIKYESLISDLKEQENYLKSCLKYPMTGCEDAIKRDKIHVKETYKLISELRAWLLIVPKPPEPEGIWVDTLNGPAFLSRTTK